ncbi:MAG: hypothetical protein ACR2O4_04135 [Hyphomicrobiaceae bacterium]
MIVWKGLGVVVAVIAFGCLLAAQLLATEYGGEGLYRESGLIKSAAMVAAAGLTYFFHMLVTGRETGKTVIDKQTGEEFHLEKKEHSLFFIPVGYWPFVLLAAAVGIYFV